MACGPAVTEATEHQLLAALRVVSRESEKLSRGKATEARHVLLWVSQTAMSLREYVVADAMRWTTAAAELECLIGTLEALRAYVAPGGPAMLPHPNELAGAGAPPPGVIMAESNARRAEQ